nr:hypothetical protein [Ruminococcus sp.]
ADESYIKEYLDCKPRKHFGIKRKAKIAVGIAAAAAFAIPVGAYAYNTFFHKDSVKHYIENAEELESRDLVANMTAADNDGEIRFTVETVLNDGKQLYAVVTAEKIADGAEKYAMHYTTGGLRYFVTAVYADNDEFITNNTSTSQYFDGTEKAAEDRRALIIDLDGVDTARGIKLLFHKERGNNFYGEGRPTGQCDNNSIPILSDCDIEISAEKNIACTELKNADGETVFLSDYELYSRPAVWNETTEFKADTTLIKSNGERIPLENIREICYMETYSYLLFDRIIDTDITGVEINGVEYLK